MPSRVYLIAVFALACSASTGLQPPLDQPFWLRIGQTAQFPKADLSVTFRAVSEDSRCPQDVVCVWEGNGQVQLAVRSGSSVRTVALNTTTRPRDVPVGSYQLRLEKLAPIPEAQHPIPPSEYVATLKLPARLGESMSPPAARAPSNKRLKLAGAPG